MLLLALACTSSTPLDEAAPLELAVAEPRRVRFAALGDVGKGNATQAQVARALKQVCDRKHCDFVLLLGDNLYPDGMVEPDDPRMDEVFTAIYGDMGLKFVAVMGNHDWGRRHYPENAQHQLDWATNQPSFVLPAPSYRVQAGDAELWAVDTDVVFWEGVEPTGSWLDRTLAASEATHKVVFGHHTYRSDGKHGNAGSYEGWSHVPWMSGNALFDLFEDHVVGKADLYVSGHDHNLQAFTYKGLDLVVSGAGASTTPLVDRGNHPDLAFSQPGFAWIELGSERLVELYGEEGQLLGRR